MSVIHLNEENFENEVEKYDGKVLVDFWATWCGPCKMMSPIVEEIAEEVGNNIKIAKIDVDANQSLAIKYGIMSIPTFILFENGEAKSTSVGMQSKTTLLNLLK